MENSKFTPCFCFFDEVADIREVDQFGAINLREAYINHVVPENVDFSPESFNNIEDAQSLLGRPSDVFDAFRKAEYVTKKQSSRAASAGAAAEAAEPTSSGNE